MKPSILRIAAIGALCLFVTSTASVSHALKVKAEPAASTSQTELEKCKADNKKLVELAGTFEEKVKHSEGEIPYLGAAYLALWLILFAFLFSWRRSQRALEQEIVELRTRLEAAEDPAE